MRNECINGSVYKVLDDCFRNSYLKALTGQEDEGCEKELVKACMVNKVM